MLLCLHGLCFFTWKKNKTFEIFFRRSFRPSSSTPTTTATTPSRSRNSPGTRWTCGTLPDRETRSNAKTSSWRWRKSENSTRRSETWKATKITRSRPSRVWWKKTSASTRLCSNGESLQLLRCLDWPVSKTPTAWQTAATRRQSLPCTESAFLLEAFSSPSFW